MFQITEGKKYFGYYTHLLVWLWLSRVVGGLLSAYDLSGDKVFLEKAKDIADRLLPAWDTPSGIPYNIINLANGNPHNPGWTGVSYWYAFFSMICMALVLTRIYATNSIPKMPLNYVFHILCMHVIWGLSNLLYNLGWQHSGRFWHRAAGVYCSFSEDWRSKISAEGTHRVNFLNLFISLWMRESDVSNFAWSETTYIYIYIYNGA